MDADLGDKGTAKEIGNQGVPNIHSHTFGSVFSIGIRDVKFDVTFSPRPQYDIPSSPEEFRKQPHSIGEKVLISGLIERLIRGNPHGSSKTVAYEIEDGVRQHKNLSFEAHESKQLKEIYKENPKKVMKVLYDNLIAVASDPRASEPEKQEMLSRYYDAAVKLTILLDDYTSPPHKSNEELWKGIPPYIPDGFISLAGSATVRTDKSIDLAKAKGIICSTLWEIADKGLNSSHEDAKKIIIDNVANWLYKNFYKEGLSNHEKLQKAGEIAQLGAVIFQQFGITTRFFTTEVSYTDRIVSHRSVNLLRVKGTWLLLDITNPEDGCLFLKPLTTRDRFAKVPQLYIPIRYDEHDKPSRIYRRDDTARYKIVSRDE